VGALCGALILAGLAGCAGTAEKPRLEKTPPPPVAVETPGRNLLKGDPKVTAHDFFLRARQMENEGNEAVALGYFRIAFEYDPESRDLCFVLVDRLRNAGLIDTALSFGHRCMELAGAPEAEELKTLGELSLRNSDLLGAVTLYEKALALDGDDRDLLYTLATLYESLKQPTQQAEVTGRLLPRLDYPPKLVEKQMELLRDLKRTEEIPALLEAAWSRGKNPIFGEKLADWYEEEGQWDSLLAVTGRLREKEPDPLQYRLRYARALALAGMTDSSFSAYQGLMKEYPEEREVAFPYGVLLFDKKHFVEAKAIFAGLVKQKPGQALYQFLLGSSAWELDDIPLAIGSLQKALDLEPRVPDYWAKLVAVKIKRGEGDQADSLLSLLQSPDTADLAVHFLRGAVYTMLARRYEAPPGGIARYQEADSSLTRRFRRASVDAYRDVLRVDPTNRRALFEVGVGLERLGLADSSILALRALVALDSNDATALNYLGYMLVESNLDLDFAGRLIQKALASEPGNGAFLDSKAWWHFRRGEYELALTFIRHSLEKMPHDTTVLEHYALILEKMGQADEAHKQWQEILRLDPHNTLATRKVN